jgi:hypothetical protein
LSYSDIKPIKICEDMSTGSAAETGGYTEKYADSIVS